MYALKEDGPRGQNAGYGDKRFLSRGGGEPIPISDVDASDRILTAGSSEGGEGRKKHFLFVDCISLDETSRGSCSR